MDLYSWVSAKTSRSSCTDIVCVLSRCVVKSSSAASASVLWMFCGVRLLINSNNNFSNSNKHNNSSLEWVDGWWNHQQVQQVPSLSLAIQILQVRPRISLDDAVLEVVCPLVVCIVVFKHLVDPVVQQVVRTQHGIPLWRRQVCFLVLVPTPITTIVRVERRQRMLIEVTQRQQRKYNHLHNANVNPTCQLCPHVVHVVMWISLNYAWPWPSNRRYHRIPWWIPRPLHRTRVWDLAARYLCHRRGDKHVYEWYRKLLWSSIHAIGIPIFVSNLSRSTKHLVQTPRITFDYSPYHRIHIVQQQLKSYPKQTKSPYIARIS